MKLIKNIIPVSLLLAVTAFAQDVRYNFAQDANFAKYKTYRWVQVPGAEKPDQLTDKQLKTAIDAELAKKGLTQVTGDTADLLIAYQLSFGSEKQLTMYDSGWGYGPGWRGGWYGGGGGFSTSTTSTITVGQLDLDMYDAHGKDLVWRGTATKTLDMNAKPDKRQKNIQKGVAKLLKNYPPPQKAKVG